MRWLFLLVILFCWTAFSTPYSCFTNKTLYVCQPYSTGQLNNDGPIINKPRNEIQKFWMSEDLFFNIVPYLIETFGPAMLQLFWPIWKHDFHVKSAEHAEWGKLFVAQLDWFVRIQCAGVSWGAGMVEEHFSWQIEAVIWDFTVNLAQKLYTVPFCENLVPVQIFNAGHTSYISETGTISLLPNRTIFDFCAARSPYNVHGLDCILVTGVYQCIPVSTTGIKRRWEDFPLHSSGLKNCSSYAFSCCLQWPNTAPIAPTTVSCTKFHTWYHTGSFSHSYSLNHIGQLQLAVCQYDTVEVCHVILHDRHSQCSPARLVKHWHAITFNRVKPISVGRRLRRKSHRRVHLIALSLRCAIYFPATRI